MVLIDFLNLFWKALSFTVIFKIVLNFIGFGVEVLVSCLVWAWCAITIVWILISMREFGINTIIPHVKLYFVVIRFNCWGMLPDWLFKFYLFINLFLRPQAGGGGASFWIQVRYQCIFSLQTNTIARVLDTKNGRQFKSKRTGNPEHDTTAAEEIPRKRSQVAELFSKINTLCLQIVFDQSLYSSTMLGLSIFKVIPKQISYPTHYGLTFLYQIGREI